MIIPVKAVYRPIGYYSTQLWKLIVESTLTFLKDLNGSGKPLSVAELDLDRIEWRPASCYCPSRQQWLMTEFSIKASISTQDVSASSSVPLTKPY